MLEFPAWGKGPVQIKGMQRTWGKPQCAGASNPGSSPASRSRTAHRPRCRNEPPAQPRRPHPRPPGLAARAALAAAADAAGAPRQR